MSLPNGLALRRTQPFRVKRPSSKRWDGQDTLNTSWSVRELKKTIEDFRADELEHRDIGLEHDAEGAPVYPVLSGAIKAGSRLAIWLSERF